MYNEDRYMAGFRDGKKQAELEAKALTRDRTMYYFIGGPLDGQNKETGGQLIFEYPIVQPVEGVTRYSYDYWRDPISFRRATYRLDMTSKGWRAYVFLGQS